MYNQGVDTYFFVDRGDIPISIKIIFTVKSIQIYDKQVTDQPVLYFTRFFVSLFSLFPLVSLCLSDICISNLSLIHLLPAPTHTHTHTHIQLFACCFRKESSRENATQFNRVNNELPISPALLLTSCGILDWIIYFLFPQCPPLQSGRS